MFDAERSRRSVVIGASAVLTASLAGCADDDDAPDDEPGDENGDDEPEEDVENGDEEELEEDEQRLYVSIEDEDGEPVSEDIEITIEAHEQPRSYTYQENIEDGQIVEEGVEGIPVEPDDYTITVESLEDEFDAVEEEVTVEESEDEEVTLTVDANGDADDGTDDDEEADDDEESEDDE
ncbi:S-layer protein [Natronolimnobius sp. AArcel1]|uniref:S-layer protein n=1 Tax=Natronolimnobius sp. AArcel1 TaxID=1679093 RepID=UPI0013EBEA55|nr:S-layer protein [Natronolimnobius sp. AArcel1]NGM70621.1 S-layer protein [Natronolimnobius sp. AArcel1]